MSACPKCRGKSQVIRSEEGKLGTRRRRECLKDECKYRWTTVEHVQEGLPTIERPERILNVGWTTQFGEARTDGRKPRQRADSEAIKAALDVDRRKREIRDSQRKRDKQEDDEVISSYRDDGFDRPPRKLTRSQLSQELYGYERGGDDGWEA